jgi:hypothetical protein
MGELVPLGLSVGGTPGGTHILVTAPGRRYTSIGLNGRDRQETPLGL